MRSTCWSRHWLGANWQGPGGGRSPVAVGLGTYKGLTGTGSGRTGSVSSMYWWGLLPLSFYGIHCGYQWWLGHPENGLWACHVAALVIGVGLLGGSATLVTVGLLWLA